MGRPVDIRPVRAADPARVEVAHLLGRRAPGRAGRAIDGPAVGGGTISAQLHREVPAVPPDSSTRRSAPAIAGTVPSATKAIGTHHVDLKTVIERGCARDDPRRRRPSGRRSVAQSTTVSTRGGSTPCRKEEPPAGRTGPA